MASSTALCSSGPMELSLSQSTSPFSSCKETACARAGSTAARTFWHTASKSTSGLSITFKGLPCSIDHFLRDWPAYVQEQLRKWCDGLRQTPEKSATRRPGEGRAKARRYDI